MSNRESDCNAKLNFKATCNKEVSGVYCQLCIDRRLSMVHTLALTDITNLPSNPAKKLIIDYSQEMFDKVVHLDLSDPSNSASNIWKIIYKEMNDKSTTWRGMTDIQVKKLVYNTRQKDNGNDILSFMEKSPLSMVKDSDFFFLQSNQTIFDDETKKWKG